MSSETTYLILDIETIPDRELFAPPEPAAGVERPFPPLYACQPIVRPGPPLTLISGKNSRSARRIAL